jgi:hypothetical protein
MKAAATKTYRQNRERFSTADLAEYDGQWAAFSADGCRIVASGESIEQLFERIAIARVDLQEVVLEKIEMETDDVHLGGAGLQ